MNFTSERSTVSEIAEAYDSFWNSSDIEVVNFAVRSITTTSED